MGADRCALRGCGDRVPPALAGEVAVALVTETKGDFRITRDDSDQTIHAKEVRCQECRAWLDEDDALFCWPDGSLSVMGGDPYCQGCAPNEKTG